MNSFLLILHEVPEGSDETLVPLVDSLTELSGGEREGLLERLQMLPIILGEGLSEDMARQWQLRLETLGASVEMIAPENPAPIPQIVSQTSLPEVEDLEGALDSLLADVRVDFSTHEEPKQSPPKSATKSEEPATPPEVALFSLNMVEKIQREEKPEKDKPGRFSALDGEQETGFSLKLGEGDAPASDTEFALRAAPPERESEAALDNFDTEENVQPTPAPEAKTSIPGWADMISAVQENEKQKSPPAGGSRKVVEKGASEKPAEEPSAKDSGSGNVARTGSKKLPVEVRRTTAAQGAVTSSRRNNKVIKSTIPAPKPPEEIEMEALPPPPVKEEARPAPVATPPARPAAETPVKSNKANIPALLLGLVIVFVVFPIIYLFLPQPSTSVSANPEVMAKLLQQQQHVLEEINSGAPIEPPMPERIREEPRSWSLKEIKEVEESEINLTTEGKNLESASFSIRGRKFGAIMQYDPKIPDQPMLFVREITAPELVPAEQGNALRGEGIVLITSGTVPYRTELDIQMTADFRGSSALITIDMKGKRHGGVSNGGTGVEIIGPGEFRISMKRTYTLRLNDDSASETDEEVPPEKPSTPIRRKGSYQRIPMEFPDAKATPVPRARR